MALYVETSDDSYKVENGAVARGLSWGYLQSMAQYVVKVRATQPELDKIRCQFSNFPGNSGKECQYFGDHASFVIANINLESGEDDDE